MSNALLLEQHRTALTGHCYRMLGSIMDAEDAVQETMLRAWKGLERFQEQASIGTWLYRIATNVCLDRISSGKRRRYRPLDLSPIPATITAEMPFPKRPSEEWIEPVPDAMVLPADDTIDPEARVLLRESIRLAFVAALQYLPPRQRAVLLLTQVLNLSALEAAEALEMTVPAVNSALQRARATLATRNPVVAPRELDSSQRELLARYVDTFERYDIAAFSALLKEDATMSMPPFAMWLRGRDSIATRFGGYGAGCRGSLLLPVEASGGTPAYAQYREGGARAWAIILLDLDGDRIAGITSFLDVETLFPRFGLPLTIER